MWIIIILVTIFLSLLLIVLNQFLIRRFYWGPSGKPPRYKSHEKAEKKIYWTAESSQEEAILGHSQIDGSGSSRDARRDFIGARATKKHLLSTSRPQVEHPKQRAAPGCFILILP